MAGSSSVFLMIAVLISAAKPSVTGRLVTRGREADQQDTDAPMNFATDRYSLGEDVEVSVIQSPSTHGRGGVILSTRVSHSTVSLTHYDSIDHSTW